MSRGVRTAWSGSTTRSRYDAGMQQRDEGRRHAGLCETCVHALKISSSRESIFYLCEVAAVDPAFPKYPRLPVLQCGGYREKPSITAREPDGRQ